MEFSLKKHDGPARFSIIKHNEHTVKCPTIVSTFNDTLTTEISINLEENTTDTDQNKIKITLLPNYLTYYDKRRSLIENKIYIIPGTGISWGLSSEFIDELLRRQVNIIEELNLKNFAVKIPLSAEEKIIDYANQFRERGAALFVITDVPTNNHYKLIRSLKIIQNLPPDVPRLLTGRIHPIYYPLFSYIGIDLFDISEIILATRENYELYDFGRKENRDAKKDQDELLQHNFRYAFEKIELTRNAIYEGWIRRLVESYSYFTPEIHTATRITFSEYYEYLEKYTPTQKTGRLICNSDLCLSSPEVQTFISRVKDRYTPYRENVKLIILFPCAARKPYSLSKTHKIFYQAIKSVARKSRSQILDAIVTSPLGLVPRELEEIYPAAHYDIPVTGEWSYEEQIVTASAIKSYLSKFNDNVKVIAHISGGYLSSFNRILSDIKQEVIFTSENTHPTSDIAIQKLKVAIQSVISERGEKIDYMKEQLCAVANYQFGKGIGRRLIPDNAKIIGKPGRPKKVLVGGKQIAFQNPDSGFLSLGIEGAKILAENKIYWVKFNGEEIKGGSLFAKAIIDADLQIRPFDEVVIIDENDEVIASGKSIMSGIEMINATRGVAVNIRHKR